MTQKACLLCWSSMLCLCVFLLGLGWFSTRLDLISPDLYQDPTLQRSRDAVCARCGDRDAVFFQAEQTMKSERLEIIFVCRCGHKWVS